MSMAAARDWDSTFDLDQYRYRIQEFQFWRLNISKFNSREVNPISNSSRDFVVYSDPSQTGSGAHMHGFKRRTDMSQAMD